MAEFVNGLLGRSSVGEMAAAMQVAPRTDHRGIIDNPIGASEMPEQAPPQQEEPQPEQAQQQAPQDGVVRQDVPPPQQPVLSDNPEGLPEDNAGNTALPPPTADEEKQARVLMSNVVDFLYGEGLQQTTKTLKMPDTPVQENIGKIASQLVTTQMDAAETANQTVSPNIIMSVGAEIVSQVYELAEALGVWQPASQEEANADMNLSLNYAANLFINTQQQTGRQDRIAGIQDVAKAASAGEYDSQPGSQFTNEMAPVPEGGLL